MNERHPPIQHHYYEHPSIHTSHPSHRQIHASVPAAPSWDITPVHGNLRSALPSWDPNPYPSGSRTEAAAQRPSPGPTTSRGRDYLRSIGPGVSDLEQRFSSLAVLNTPYDLNKPLPAPPRTTHTVDLAHERTGPLTPPRPFPSAVDLVSRAEAASPSTPSHRQSPIRTRLKEYDLVGPYSTHTTPGPQSRIVHTVSLPAYTTTSSSSPSRPLKEASPKTSRPSTYVVSPSHLRPPFPESRPARPYSDSITPTPTRPHSKAKAKTTSSSKSKRPTDPIYVVDSDDGDTSSSDVEYVTTRSPARRRRAESERPPSKGPRSSGPLTTNTAKAVPSAAKTPTKQAKGHAVQCSGYTKEGQKCKRMVRATAAYFDMSTPFTNEADGDGSGERGEARYCKDHANLVIDQPGFSWMGTDIYIRYDGELRQRTIRGGPMELIARLHTGPSGATDTSGVARHHGEPLDSQGVTGIPVRLRVARSVPGSCRRQ